LPDEIGSCRGLKRSFFQDCFDGRDPAIGWFK